MEHTATEHPNLEQLVPEQSGNVVDENAADVEIGDSHSKHVEKNAELSKSDMGLLICDYHVYLFFRTAC